MHPVDFPEAQRVLRKPEGMSDEECGPLPVFTNGTCCISCWELSDDEMATLLHTRRLWLWVHSGITQPPVCPSVDNPFVSEGRN